MAGPRATRSADAGAPADRRMPVPPGPGRLKLGGQRDERRLVAEPPSEHDTDRQPVNVPVQRQVHGWLARDVVQRRVRRESFLPLEVLGRIDLVEVADWNGWCGERWAEEGVIPVEGRNRWPHHALEISLSEEQLTGADVLALAAQVPGQRQQFVLLLGLDRRQRSDRVPEQLEAGHDVRAEGQLDILDLM